LAVIQALKEPGAKYYFRVNTLRAATVTVLERLKSRGLNALPVNSTMDVLYFEIDGPKPLPNTKHSVEVDKNTAESVLLGANVYAPGVTACQGLRLGSKVTVTDPHGEAVGVGISKMNERQILGVKKGIAIEVTSPKYAVPNMRQSPEFLGGLIFPQSLPAIISGLVLGPTPQDVVVDLCASPGGKTTHLAQLMGNKGTIIAIDRSQEKISRLRETIGRLHVKNVTLMCHDSRYIDRDYPNLRVDKVLVDPPCSALGLRPRVHVDSTKEDIIKLARYQRQFLKAAANIVKSGGLVAYSVCTMTREECEENTKYVIDECGLELIKQPIILGSPGIERFCSGASLAQRFAPHIHDTSGYYIALFRKT
jgi:predicted RNA-binding protein (TIGR00451 family)